MWPMRGERIPSFSYMCDRCAQTREFFRSVGLRYTQANFPFSERNVRSLQNDRNILNGPSKTMAARSPHFSACSLVAPMHDQMTTPSKWEQLSSRCRHEERIPSGTAKYLELMAGFVCRKQILVLKKRIESMPTLTKLIFRMFILLVIFLRMNLNWAMIRFSSVD